MRPLSAITRKSRMNSNDGISPTNKSFNDQIPDHVFNVFDADALRNQKIKEMNRKYDQILDKIQFMDQPSVPQNDRKYQYSSETLMPYIYFFKYLAKRPYDTNESEQDKKTRLKLWIPDTIVLNDLDCPGMWFYSSAEGYVYRSDMFFQKNIIVKFSEGATNENELIAVLKKPQYKNLELVGNDVKPVQVKELNTLIANIIGSRGDVTILQKFVRSKGPKTYICRSVWRRNQNPIAWVITNKTDIQDDSQPELNRVIASGSKRFSCTIFSCTGGRFVSETQPFVNNILNWMRVQFKVEFDEIACDFIHGRDNKWYFINLRGFSISKCQVPLPTRQITHYGDDSLKQESSTPHNRIKKHTNAKKKPCKFCQIVFPCLELTHQMTLKMVMQTDLHLIHRGRKMKWIEERQILQHFDIPMLYHQYAVCVSCYTLYLACEELIQLEFEFAKKLGVEVDQDSRYNLVSVSHLDHRTKGRNVMNQTKANGILGNGENYLMPQDWELQAPLNSELLLLNNQPLLNNKSMGSLNQFRMFVLLHKIEEIPLKMIENGAKFSIQFTWLQQKVNYVLDFNQAISHPKGCELHLNKLKFFYFFSPDRSTVTNFLTKIPSLQLQVLENNEKLGQVECELRDFKSERVVNKDFYKQFTGKLIPILSWGLHLTIGLADSGSTDINDIRLYEQDGVYLPEPSYYTCEPLPSDWMSLMRSTNNSTTSRGRPLNQSTRHQRSFSQKRSQQKSLHDSSFLNYNSQKKDLFVESFVYSLEQQQQMDKSEFTELSQMKNLLSKEIIRYESDTKCISTKKELYYEFI